MRAGLWWTLGGVLVASAAALLWPARRWDVVAPLARSDAPSEGGSTVAQAAATPLPSSLEPLVVDPAKRDPFALQPSPTPAAQAVAPPAPPPPPTAAPPPPPPSQWRVMGTMKTPEGATLVLLSRNDDQSVVATPGLRLEDGFEVTSIDATGVRLRHVAYPEDAVVPIPPPPEPGR
jgi:hypothetical protein